MIGVFKREARVVAYEKETGEEGLEDILNRLVGEFILLVEGCGFREVSAIIGLFTVEMLMGDLCSLRTKYIRRGRGNGRWCSLEDARVSRAYLTVELKANANSRPEELRAK